MLKPTWYLTNVDWYAQWPDAPKLDNDGQAVLGQIAELFHDESYFNPAKTAATTLVMLLAAEHLGDVITYAAGQHDGTELARLIGGPNLIQAHLTQIIQTVAEHATSAPSTAWPTCPPRRSRPSSTASAPPAPAARSAPGTSRKRT